MTSEELRSKFLAFFEQRGHKIIPASSLVPKNDTSVLFTTAGMQQFKPYYIEQAKAQDDFGGLNTTSVQTCVRTSDIDEVGDNTHLTFFEMLGNFSFGGYGKKEAISYAYDFITKELNLTIDYVTFFKGNANVPRDNESAQIWAELGVKDIREDGADVFWGPTGNSGPCGPTTEIYVNGVEIWNIVFNQYFCASSREELDRGHVILTELPNLGIDTGMGLERLLTMIQNVDGIYKTDLFAPILSEIKQQTAKFSESAARIIADHVRTAVFMIADGVTPSNTDRGYILRRIIRRAVRYADQMQADNDSLSKVASVVIEKYKKYYSDLDQNREKILEELKKEEEKFRQTLSQGLKEFERVTVGKNEISSAKAFSLFSTFGFPFELTKELAKEKGLKIDEEGFKEQLKKHQEISKAGAAQKFKGGLASTGEMETKYHTATHLLLASLRQVLGQNIVQKGSNITSERLRFDFNWPEKLAPEQIKAVEDLVNTKITEKIPVFCEEMSPEEARRVGATGSFEEKYGEIIKIYSIGSPSTSSGPAFSREFCGGPHVANTGDLASTDSVQVSKFKILKEEAVAAGVRRIKAVLE